MEFVSNTERKMKKKATQVKQAENALDKELNYTRRQNTEEWGREKLVS